ncbi:hypothetical protein Ahy_A03g015195 [Arachis hypogaea]|uniref:Aminotransferase-like plant mobile domain-containing protein n=1 Tax=Arachis hypogaea TaxID=3818 RepID=A0A445DZR1_ARAHY|nr:hypothetical protein Ahy_A03g015195 [Arachis hypogaea]
MSNSNLSNSNYYVQYENNNNLKDKESKREDNMSGSKIVRSTSLELLGYYQLTFLNDEPLGNEFESASFEPFFPSPTPPNPRENDPDSLRRRPERNTLLNGDDPARLYRLDVVAHIARAINEEWFSCVVHVSCFACASPSWNFMRWCFIVLVIFVVGYEAGSNNAVYVTCSPSDASGACGGSRACDSMTDTELQLVLETFGECPDGADDETVRRYARAYIMMLLGTQLFGDKSGNRIHIRWLLYVARLEEMGTYSWGSAALAWLYRCMYRVANRHVVKLAGPLQLLQSWIFWRFPRFRPSGYETFSWPLASRWSGYNPSGSEKGPRVEMWRLRIDRLQDREFIWMPYNTLNVLQVVHPEVLEPRNMALWQSVTSLIYFVVIEWHQIDMVLPQFGGVQPLPNPALNIDFLMWKDGRGGDRWFPYDLQKWHLYWESRADTVLRFDVVADPGPSHLFLEWWSQHGKRYAVVDPRAVPIPVEASQRGAGRVPDMDRPEDVPDRRRVERRARVGTRRSQREWRWLDAPIDDDDDAGPARGGRRGQGGRRRGRGADDDDDDQHGPVGGNGAGAGAVGGVSTHDGRHGGEWYGSGMGDGAEPGDTGLGPVPLGDYFVGVPAHDQPQQEGTPWVIPGPQWSDFLGSDTLDADFGGPQFLADITAIMRGETSGTQAPLDVDLNEPPTASVGDHFGLGGTPPSAYAAASESVARSSAAPVHFTPPAQPAPDEDADEIEDEEPFIRRGQRARVPRRCFTGSHLFR